ncbi:MAG: hypothetical protein WBB86_04355 [Candidatus Omnitrophota bacterium]
MAGVIKKMTAIGFFLALCVFCLTAVLINKEAEAETVLWDFEIPIELKEMPKSITHIAIHWYLLDKKGKTITDDIAAEIPVDFTTNGNFKTILSFQITDNDIDDPTAPKFCQFRLELSQDGMSYYPHDEPGEPWTNHKKGTKSPVPSTITNLQTDNPVPYF